MLMIATEKPQRTPTRHYYPARYYGSGGLNAVKDSSNKFVPPVYKIHDSVLNCWVYPNELWGTREEGAKVYPFDAAVKKIVTLNQLRAADEVRAKIIDHPKAFGRRFFLIFGAILISAAAIAVWYLRHGN